MQNNSASTDMNQDRDDHSRTDTTPLNGAENDRRSRGDLYIKESKTRRE